MKNKNREGFTNHIVMITLAVVVLAGIGFAGWRVWQKNYGLSARAAGYTQIKISPSYAAHSFTPQFAGCKTYVGTKGRADLWRITIIASRPDKSVTKINVGAVRGTQGVGGSNGITSSWYAGKVASTQVTVPDIQADRILISYYTSQKSYGYSDNLNPSTLVNC